MSSVIDQLHDNYRAAFGERPSEAELKTAIHFVYLFLAEVGTVCAGTHYAQSASNLSGLIDFDYLPSATAENIEHWSNEQRQKRAQSDKQQSLSGFSE